MTALVRVVFYLVQKLLGRDENTVAQKNTARDKNPATEKELRGLS